LKSDKFQIWAKRNNITNYITYKNKTYIDYYIDFDNLEEDFELIKKISGKKGNLLIKNKSNHKKYENY